MFFFQIVIAVQTARPDIVYRNFFMYSVSVYIIKGVRETSEVICAAVWLVLFRPSLMFGSISMNLVCCFIAL